MNLSRPASALLLLAASGAAHAQSSSNWGRFTLFAQASRQDAGGETRDFRELISTLALHGGNAERSGLEYALEAARDGSAGPGRRKRRLPDPRKRNAANAGKASDGIAPLEVPDLLGTVEVTCCSAST